MSTSTGIDKQALYGEYLDRQRWKDKLYKRAAHKSLDIPEDDMQINVNKGLGTVGALGIAGMAGLPGAILAALLVMSKFGGEPSAPSAGSPPPSAQSLQDSEYQVRFYDKDGNLIPVPHVSQRKTP